MLMVSIFYYNEYLRISDIYPYEYRLISSNMLMGKPQSRDLRLHKRSLAQVVSE